MQSITVSVRTAPADCWACGAETNIVSFVELSRGGVMAGCSIADFTDYPQLIEAIQANLKDKVEVGALKPRYSKTLERSYMSNGCAHCDALFGQHFELQTRYDESEAAKFAATGSEGWDKMLDELLASEDGHLFHC